MGTLFPLSLKKFYLLLVTLSISLCLSAQAFYTSIKTFNESDGFHAAETSSIIQDRKGLIWIASRNGLYRFNGTSFKLYKHVAADSFSLPANQVNFCYQDKDGDYWVGVFGKGLYRFDEKTEKFTSWKNSNNKEINTASLYNVIAPFEDSKGQLWFSAATIGIFRLNKKERTVKLFNVCDQFNPLDLFRSCRWVHHFAEDKDGSFWLSSNDGMIHFNPSNGAFKDFRHYTNEVTGYFKDSEGQQWVGTWGSGLKKIDTTVAEWKQYLWTEKAANTTNIITGIEEKDRDHLWIASLDAGPMIFDKRTGRFTAIATQNKNEQSIGGASSMIKDRDGNIWITGAQQLSRINAGNLINYVHIGNPALKNPKLVSCFLHPPGDSLVFIGTVYTPEGLHTYNLKSGITALIKLHSPLATEDIADIFSDSRGLLWLATSYGVYSMERKTLQPKRLEIPTNKYASYFTRSMVKVLEDQKHRLWFISRWQGLFCLDQQSKTIVHYSTDSVGKYHIPVDQIEYASFDKYDNLWVGTHAYLQEQPPVFCITQTGEVINYGKKIPLNSVFQITQLSQNRIMAATVALGLFELTSALQANETLRQFSEDDGIADSYVEGFAEDKNGNLWITTHNGLSCMRPNQRILNFHTEDGLSNNKIEGRPYIDDQGNLFLPFENGFQFFNVDSLLNHHPSIGRVMLESLTINQKKYEGNADYLQELHLAHGENNLSFEFAAFDLSQGDKLQYAYQLSGPDTSWNVIGASRRLFFSNLSPGHYQLKIRAGDRFGNWSKEVFTLPITIQPPFWKTWWFYVLCFFVASALVYLFYRIRLNTFLAEQKLRNKIARDLHDDIGSTLSGIRLFSNMAQNKLAEEQSSALNIVERIGERSEKMMDAMSDIVWSINPVNDSIDNMLVRMKQYAAEMMEPKDINFTFQMEQRISGIRLGIETRKDVYLIFKEAINNAVKHSGCGSLVVSLKLHRKTFELSVTDDGKGFDNSRDQLNGNGLKNFKERAKNIGGELLVISQPGQGTTVRLNLPLTS